MGIAKRAVRWAVGSACVALAVTGCSVHPGPAPDLSDGKAFTEVQRLSDAPAAVRDADLECGTFELDHSETLPASAVECVMDAAAGGEPAALAWTSPTVEGDPIVSFALVEAGSTEVTVHESTYFDRFGEPGWTRWTCAATDFTDTGCPYP